MRQLRDALAEIVEREFDPVYRAAPANGHDLMTLRMGHKGEVIDCLKGHSIAMDVLENSEIPGFVEWCRSITIPTTLTYMLLDRVFSHLPIGTCVNLEDMNRVLQGVYMEKHISKAMERLVRITHSKMYNLDFIVESSGNGGYKIEKRSVNGKIQAQVVADGCGSNECTEEDPENVIEDLFNDNATGATLNDDFEEEAYEVSPVKTIVRNSRRASKGMDFRLTIFNHERPTSEYQEDMVQRAQSKDKEIARKAMNELVKNNARYILWCAKGFEIFSSNPIFWDVFQEGAMGLQKAAEKFEFKKGVKFLTYAKWWIRSFMQRFLMKNKFSMSVSFGDMCKVQSLKKIIREAKVTGVTITFNDLMEMTGMEEERVRILWDISKIQDVSISSPTIDRDGVQMSVNTVLERAMAEIELHDPEHERVAFGADVKLEAESFIKVLRKVQEMIGGINQVGAAKLSKEDILIRDFYVLFRRLDLYDMPWGDITMSDIAQECGIEREAINHIVNMKMRPKIEIAMREMGYSEGRIQAYKELLDFWTRTHDNISESRTIGKVETAKARKRPNRRKTNNAMAIAAA